MNFDKENLLEGIRKALSTIGMILLSLGSLIGLNWLTPELIAEGQEAILAAVGGILALIAWITGLSAEKKKEQRIKEKVLAEIHLPEQEEEERKLYK